jgi:hypothetical protein
MFDWSDTVFRRRNVTRRRISNTVLQGLAAVIFRLSYKLSITKVIYSWLLHAAGFVENSIGHAPPKSTIKGK